MQRAVLVVLLALITFDVSGLSALCGNAACDDDCPTDLSGGECAPNCHTCSCCSLPKVAGAATPAAITLPSGDMSWVATSDDPVAPEPADILHVPKHALA